AERGAAARLLEEQWPADFLRDQTVLTATDVSQELVALTVRTRAGLLDVGIHVTIGDEEVEQAVVVHIDKPDAPSEVRPHCGDQSGPETGIHEQGVALVEIESGVVLREIGGHDVESAVSVDV